MKAELAVPPAYAAWIEGRLLSSKCLLTYLISALCGVT
jgi:hypothetical protein